jgi:hypothetical protein
MLEETENAEEGQEVLLKAFRYVIGSGERRIELDIAAENVSIEYDKEGYTQRTVFTRGEDMIVASLSGEWEVIIRPEFVDGPRIIRGKDSE